MPLLSLIIPLYNTEKFIGECLSSILNSSADKADYEVIVIDDGSTDGSGEIVQLFSKMYYNIHYIRQENQGVSVARMIGAEKATGDHLWFIDSDDYLLDGALEEVMHLIRNNLTIDTFLVQLLIKEEGREYVKPFASARESIMTGKLYLKMKPVSVCPVQFIFKKVLLDNRWIYFPEGLRHEDEYFCRTLQYFSGTIKILEKPLYVYRQWYGSYMNSGGVNALYDMVGVYQHLKEFVEKGADFEDRGWLQADIISFLMGTHSWHRHLFNKEEFLTFRNKHLDFIYGEFRKSARLFTYKDRVLGYLLLKQPKIYSLLLSAKKRLFCL